MLVDDRCFQCCGGSIVSRCMMVKYITYGLSPPLPHEIVSRHARHLSTVVFTEAAHVVNWGLKSSTSCNKTLYFAVIIAPTLDA